MLAHLKRKKCDIDIGKSSSKSVFQDQNSGYSFLKQIQKENMDKINIRVEKEGFLKLLRLCVNMCPPPPTLLGYLGQVPSYFLSRFCLCAFLFWFYCKSSAVFNLLCRFFPLLCHAAYVCLFGYIILPIQCK